MIDLYAALVGAEIGLATFCLLYEWANAEDLK